MWRTKPVKIHACNTNTTIFPPGPNPTINPSFQMTIPYEINILKGRLLQPLQRGLWVHAVNSRRQTHLQLLLILAGLIAGNFLKEEVEELFISSFFSTCSSILDLITVLNYKQQQEINKHPGPLKMLNNNSTCCLKVGVFLFNISFFHIAYY